MSIGPHQAEQWPVFIESAGGVDKVLNVSLTAAIKAAHVTNFGVVLDADDYAAGRYQRIQQLCSALFPSMPVTLPVEGLVVDNGEKRFGVWLMPDNQAQGDLETFLRFLVPDSQARTWTLACDSVDRSRHLGAAWRDPHQAKARLYTWLAWQDQPGQSPGIALTARILDPKSNLAAPFVAWFRDLYQL
jgi:hypothetical protein